TQVSWLELTGYMRSTLLRDGDSMSMAHSIELRLPFLDHELVECCLRLGAPGFHGGRYKALLLAAAGDLLPARIAGRLKRGFVLPMDRWMGGPLSGFVPDGLRRLAGTGAVPRTNLSHLQTCFRPGRLPWSRLWEFVVLGHWLDTHLS